jgi:hypothetical protein
MKKNMRVEPAGASWAVRFIDSNPSKDYIHICSTLDQAIDVAEKAYKGA